MLAMSPKLALSIAAVVAVLVGLGLVLVPGQVLAGFGLPSNEGLAISRDTGVTLIAIGLINWLGRSATGTPLRALLIGNLFLHLAEIVVDGLQLATGVLSSAAAPGLVPHVLLGAMFVAALMRPEEKAA